MWVANDSAAWTNAFHCFLLLTCSTFCLPQVLFALYFHYLSFLFIFCGSFYPTLMLLTLLLIKARVLHPLYMSVLLYVFVSSVSVSIWFKSSLMSTFFILCFLLAPALVYHPVYAVSIVHSLPRVQHSASYSSIQSLAIITATATITVTTMVTELTCFIVAKSDSGESD